MNPNLEVRVSIFLPHGGKKLTGAIQVAETTYNESFAPLPRNREIPFEYKAQERAAMQVAFRQKIARDLGQQIAWKLLELIEAEDPQHGYSPEEWKLLNQDCKP